MLQPEQNPIRWALLTKSSSLAAANQTDEIQKMDAKALRRN